MNLLRVSCRSVVVGQALRTAVRSANLKRTNWDELHGSETYDEMTIRRIIRLAVPSTLLALRMSAMRKRGATCSSERRRLECRFGGDL